MNKTKLLALLAILALPSFCFSLNLKNEVKERRLPTYIIENHSYLSLKSFLKIINAEDSWGKVEDRIFIIYGADEIKFRINDKQLIFGAADKNLEAPIKEIEGEILVPLEDFSKLFSEAKAAAPLQPHMQEVSLKDEASFNKGEQFAILIDPGHGGKDAGAVGNFGLKEKDVNLDVALRMADYLKKKLRKYPHVRIYMTRDTDVFISLEDRVRMAEEIKADIFFSIHTNSSRDRRHDASGFETYYPKEKTETISLPAPLNPEGVEEDAEPDFSLIGILEDLNKTDAIDESKILADFVQERMAEKLLTPDRGTKRRNFYVLKFTPMPSVLTEIGFICNPNIELNLRDIEVREAIAVTLGNAMADYLKLKNIIPKDS